MAGVGPLPALPSSVSIRVARLAAGYYYGPEVRIVKNLSSKCSPFDGPRVDRRANYTRISGA
jgi:hypothetical protein